MALSRIAQRSLGIDNRLFESGAGCAPLLDLLAERRFALGQALDVGSGRSVVVPCVLEGGDGVAQLLCEAVAIGSSMACSVAARRSFCRTAVEFRLALGGLLAGVQASRVARVDGLVERGFRGSQSTFEIGTAVDHFGEAGVELLLACRETRDVSGRRFQILSGQAQGGFELA